MSKIGTAEIRKIAFQFEDTTTALYNPINSIGLQAYYGDHLIYGKNMVVEQGTHVKTRYHSGPGILWFSHQGPVDFCKVCNFAEYISCSTAAGFPMLDYVYRDYGIVDPGNYQLFDYNTTDNLFPAFGNCDNIETLEVLSDSSLYAGAFHDCSSLTDVSIGENVYIGRQVFKDCSSLVHVTLPVDVSYIGADAFSGTPWLTNYIENYNQNIIYIGKVAYGHKNTVTGNLTINSGTKSIYQGAFKNTDITSLYIPDSAEFIGYQSFMGCHNLTYASIHGTVYQSAFSNCENLQNVNIPDSIYIGRYAFSDCSSLSNINLTDNLEAIGMFAFQNTGLTSIDIPGTVIDLGSNIFIDCSVLQTAVIRGGSYNNRLYGKDDYMLYMDTLPSNIFKNCTSLSNVTLHYGIEAIDAGAFENCTALRSIVLPKSVQCIDFSAFNGCSNLNIYILSPFVIGTQRINNPGWPSTVKVYVRESLVNDYKTRYSGNSGFGNYVYGLTDASIAEIPIVFSDSSIESICIDKYDTSNKGFVNESDLEDASINYTTFRGKAIHSFTELDYFTNVTTIPGYAFMDCSVLKTVHIPYHITAIGNYAFKNCSKLTTCKRKYVIDEYTNTVYSNLTIGNEAFRGSSITTFQMYGVTSVGTGAFRDCKKLSSLYIDSVLSCPDYVCMGCSSLNDDGIQCCRPFNSIGVSSFQDCVSISKLNLNNVTTIGANAFYGSGIDRVMIGSQCTSIGNSAFYADKLQYVWIKATIPPSIDTPFPLTVAFIAVPDNSVDAYKSASDWAIYQDKIISQTECLYNRNGSLIFNY